MLQLHRTIGTYTGGIDRYVALTQFARAKMLKGGILERKLSVKPNFLPDPPAAGGGGGGYAIFVGRLLEGKGADTLLQAWRLLPGVRLKIVGDGALRPRLEAIARRDGLNVEFTGRLQRSAVLEAVSRAELMVVPSTWYEGFPMVVAESFACGTPVVASRIGSLAELVQNGVTGRHFTPGDAPALALAVQHLLAGGSGLRRMRHASRAYFEAHLTEDRNYEQLMSIYREAVGRDSAKPGWDGRARSSDGNTAG
jgi:glycosyltransferase involved in cell wall biosynthesis